LFPFIGLLNEDEINNAFFQQDCSTANTAHRLMELLEDVFGARQIQEEFGLRFHPTSRHRTFS
jgi:hypothetical protein